MNKSELVKAIAEKSEASQATAAKMLDATLNAISDALEKKEDVALIGFGTFSVKERAARTGRNPQTGGEIQIKASNVPSFKAGKTLKDSCNK